MKKFRLTSLALLLMGGVILNSCNKNSNSDDPNNPAGQGGGPDDQYKIVITTEKAIGEEISIYYSPFPIGHNIKPFTPEYTEKAKPLWIDFNNNGIRENGEFGTHTGIIGDITGVVGSQTITIYGKVTKLTIKEEGITSIDTSQNSYLEELNILNNPLETLDITHNPNLKIVYIADNESLDLKSYSLGLKSISLSADKNPKLEDLWIKAKEIKTLDISNFPELNSLYLYGMVKNIEIHNNPRIEKLLLRTDKMESVDVSNSPGLETLSLNTYTATPDLKKVNLVNTPKLDSFHYVALVGTNVSYDISLCVQADADRVNNIPERWGKSRYVKEFKQRTTINYQTTPCP